MAEMKAIIKRLASGLRKPECRQHCRRLTHICPHSDRSLGLIDWEQSGCHYGSFSPSISLFYSLFSFSAGAFEFSQFLLSRLLPLPQHSPPPPHTLFFFRHNSCIHISSTRQNWRFPEGITIRWARNKPTSIDSWTLNITTLFWVPVSHCHRSHSNLTEDVFLFLKMQPLWLPLLHFFFITIISKTYWFVTVDKNNWQTLLTQSSVTCPVYEAVKRCRYGV